MNAYGHRIYGQREHEAAPPPPELRRSPLAEPQGASALTRLPECAEYDPATDTLKPTCMFYTQCWQSVVRLGGFANQTCEQACNENQPRERRTYTDKRPRLGMGQQKRIEQRKAQKAATRAAIVDTVREYGPITASQVAEQVGITVEYTRGILYEFAKLGIVRRAGSVPVAMTQAILWEA